LIFKPGGKSGRISDKPPGSGPAATDAKHKYSNDSRAENPSGARLYHTRETKLLLSQICFALGFHCEIMNAIHTLMKGVACQLVGMDVTSRAIAQNAAGLVFPGSVITPLDTLAEALRLAPESEVELLVLANPDRADLVRAVEAMDATGLRRWAIVVLGIAPAIEGVEIVAAEEWTEPVVARALRSAVAQYRLLRDNARMAGDLRTMARRISHDLRTPLGGIFSTGEALKELLMEQDPASVPLVKSLFVSVGDLEKLIDRVSLLTRASTSPVAKRPVDMEEILWTVMQRLERLVLKTGVGVIRPDAWPAVTGVSSWLETVWWNLLANALQHGEEATRVELGWTRNDREFRFWVGDNGGGVPAEKIGTLFQPFHLLHHANARKGLGLSIVQRLIELQGGGCGYEPGAAGGSVFYFTLPAEECPAAKQTSPPSENAAGGFGSSPATPDPNFQRATRPN
jgi:signal transduction histidine kinase